MLLYAKGIAENPYRLKPMGVSIWDGKSRGAKNMLYEATLNNLKIRIVNYNLITK